MNQQQLAVQAREILSDHHGRNNAITSQELSERLGGLDSLDSTPNTRMLIRSVMEEYKIPIVGSPHGYFVATTQSEYLNAQKRLSQRLRGIEKRKRLLNEAWETSEIENPQQTL